MKSYLATFFLLGFLALNSCSKKNSQPDDPAGKPVKEPAVILSSFGNWWNYTSLDVKLYENFVAYDTASREIKKDEFMNQLSTGEYLPLKLKGENNAVHYKLYKLADTTDADIKANLKNWMSFELAHYNLEDKPLPDFNFVDINGKTYNPETTKGKIVVMKSWFIGCKPCVEEMPELNKLVAKYKDRDDIVFVSLATDKKDKLQEFLKKKQFDYAVVAEKEQYISDKLKMRAFPTHFIINKEGLVHKVVSSGKVLGELLDEEVAKTL